MQDINQNLTTLTQVIQVWRRQKALAYQARIRAGAALEDGPTQDITAVLQGADQAIAHALAAWQELAWERYRTVTGIDQTPVVAGIAAVMAGGTAVEG